MTAFGNLWAVGFDDIGRAAQVRDELTSLAWEKHQLELLDIAVAVRYRDGCLTLNGEPFAAVKTAKSGMLAHFFASLAINTPPLTCGAVEQILDGVGGGACAAGISDDFVRGVVDLIKPETSVLFVLDEGGNMDAILHAIRGLGGTVLKTNVDLERAKLIQSTLGTSGEKDASKETSPNQARRR